MIVECPSCLTKFSLDAQQLADIVDPRFHCCRCGSYFELQQSPGSAIAPLNQSTEQQASNQNASDESHFSPTEDDLELLNQVGVEDTELETLSTSTAANIELESDLADSSPPTQNTTLQTERTFTPSAPLKRSSWSLYSETDPEPKSIMQPNKLSGAGKEESPSSTQQKKKMGFGLKLGLDALRFGKRAHNTESGSNKSPDISTKSATEAKSDSGISQPPQRKSGFTLGSETTGSGKWLVAETIAASKDSNTSADSRDWTPDPNAIIDDLRETSPSGEQLPLLNERDSQELDTLTHKPTVSGMATHTSHTQQGDLHTEDTVSASSSNEEDVEPLITAEWPDSGASSRRAATQSRLRPGWVERGREASSLGSSGLAKPTTTRTTAVSTEMSASTERPSSHPESSVRSPINSGAKPLIAKTPAQPIVSASSQERKTKVAELLAQATARQAAEEAAPPLARENEHRANPADEDAETSRQRKKALRRAKKQQRLIRGDVTFRQKAALGKLPTLPLREQAPVACIVSVPIILLLGIVMLASGYDALPNALQYVLDVHEDSLPRLPPPGLGLVDLSSSVVTLDSGHRALEIRGEVLNATSEQYSRIMLLASVFNEANERIGSMIIDPNNELQRAQVVALDAESIARLQNQLSQSTLVLEPNARVPFRIVFPDYTGQERWFSTSVYNVEL